VTSATTSFLAVMIIVNAAKCINTLARIPSAKIQVCIANAVRENAIYAVDNGKKKIILIILNVTHTIE
jgi:hypothetical protein